MLVWADPNWVHDQTSMQKWTLCSLKKRLKMKYLRNNSVQLSSHRLLKMITKGLQIWRAGRSRPLSDSYSNQIEINLQCSAQLQRLKKKLIPLCVRYAANNSIQTKASICWSNASISTTKPAWQSTWRSKWQTSRFLLPVLIARKSSLTKMRGRFSPGCSSLNTKIICSTQQSRSKMTWAAAPPRVVSTPSFTTMKLSSSASHAKSTIVWRV